MSDVRSGLAIALTTALAACGSPETKSNGETPRMAAPSNGLLSELAPAQWADAAAVLVDPDGAEIGHVVLTQTPGAGVLMRIDIQGLTQGWHAMHLLETGDCSDGASGFTASGGHINPDGRAHGLLNPDGPVRADLPNIYAGADGRATAEVFNQRIALFPSEEAAAEIGPHPLFDDDGFALIVHQNPDDHITQPIGGAGQRVACAAFAGDET